MAAVQQNGLALQWVSTKFQNENPKIVMAAVQKMAWLYASPDSHKNSEIVMERVEKMISSSMVTTKFQNKPRYSHGCCSAKWLGSSMGLNKISNKADIVMAAVQQNGLALQWVSTKFQTKQI